MFSDTFAISGRALGSGGYGRVHLAHHNKHALACKVVSFERLWGEICTDFDRRGRMNKISEMHKKFIEVKARTLEEIRLWRKFDHVRTRHKVSEQILLLMMVAEHCCCNQSLSIAP